MTERCCERGRHECSQKVRHGRVDSSVAIVRAALGRTCEPASGDDSARHASAGQIHVQAHPVNWTGGAVCVAYAPPLK